MHIQRREYPDGTSKTIYPDGKQETLYANGRLRIKNSKGTVILDKKVNFAEEKAKLQWIYNNNAMESTLNCS